MYFASFSEDTSLRALSSPNLGWLLPLPCRPLFQLAKLSYYYGTTAISCTLYLGPQEKNKILLKMQHA